MGAEVDTPIQLYPRGAENKRHPETVVFVHNMLGSQKTILRHSLMMNDFGYDTVSFNLVWGSKDKNSLKHPLAWRLPFGVFRLWRTQIQRVFDQVPGPKILYGFSGPSLAAFLACANRTDIKLVICDGGPFRDFPGNTKNLFKFNLGVKYERPLKALAMIGGYVWGPASEKALHQTLQNWDSSVPILSIRGGQDPVVLEPTIKAVFDAVPDLPLTVLRLPEGKHMDGLKNFTEVYQEAVSQFLGRQPQS